MKNNVYGYLTWLAVLFIISCDASDTTATTNETNSSSSAFSSLSSSSIGDNSTSDTIKLCPNESIKILDDDGYVHGVYAPSSGDDTTFIYGDEIFNVVIKDDCLISSSSSAINGAHYYVTGCDEGNYTVQSDSGALDLYIPYFSQDTILYYNKDTIDVTKLADCDF